jgi:hypothetical protein
MNTIFALLLISGVPIQGAMTYDSPDSIEVIAAKEFFGAAAMYHRYKAGELDLPIKGKFPLEIEKLKDISKIDITNLDISKAAKYVDLVEEVVGSANFKRRDDGVGYTYSFIYPRSKGDLAIERMMEINPGHVVTTFEISGFISSFSQYHPFVGNNTTLTYAKLTIDAREKQSGGTKITVTTYGGTNPTWWQKRRCRWIRKAVARRAPKEMAATVRAEGNARCRSVSSEVIRVGRIVAKEGESEAQLEMAAYILQNLANFGFAVNNWKGVYRE